MKALEVELWGNGSFRQEQTSGYQSLFTAWTEVESVEMLERMSSRQGVRFPCTESCIACTWGTIHKPSTEVAFLPERKGRSHVLTEWRLVSSKKKPRSYKPRKDIFRVFCLISNRVAFHIKQGVRWVFLHFGDSISKLPIRPHPGRTLVKPEPWPNKFCAVPQSSKRERWTFQTLRARHDIFFGEKLFCGSWPVWILIIPHQLHGTTQLLKPWTLSQCSSHTCLRAQFFWICWNPIS